MTAIDTAAIRAAYDSIPPLPYPGDVVEFEALPGWSAAGDDPEARIAAYDMAEHDSDAARITEMDLS